VVKVKEMEPQALNGRVGNPLCCGDEFTRAVDFPAPFDVYRMLFLFL
jgi:hypothetical protein